MIEPGETSAVDPTAIVAEPAPESEPTPHDEAGVIVPGETTDPTAIVAEPAPESEPATPAAPAHAAAPRPPRAKPSPRVASLYRCYRSGRPVEGTIERVIKGGYEVRLGEVRGFCPHSQIDVVRESEPERHVGLRYPFRITQVRRGGADVVLSRRAVLLAEREDEAKAVRATLLEGGLTRGRVSGLAEFGAFVDLGAGVMGLVHVSEIAHGRVVRVEDAVRVGDVVSVKVLRLHEEGQRISLSIRQATRDPWEDVSERFRPGSITSGTARRMADFGLFVELAPGVEALAPASELPPAPRDWREQWVVGQERDWLVLAVDAERRRLTVTPALEGFPADAVPEPGTERRGLVQRIESFGVFVWLGPGRVALMPNALSGVPRGADMARSYPIGEAIEVEVLEVDPKTRRIRVARKGARREREAASQPAPPPARKPVPQREPSRRVPRREPEPAVSATTFGNTLAEKLRAALGSPAEPR